MNTSAAGPSSKARVGSSQPSESSLKRKRGMFQKDLQHMMYGFGDESNIHCLQFLIYEVVSGGNMRKPGGLFGNTGSEIPVNDLKQLETFFYKLGFFLHVLDYTASVSNLIDVGFMWFREFYLQSSRVIQRELHKAYHWMLPYLLMLKFICCIPPIIDHTAQQCLKKQQDKEIAALMNSDNSSG